MKSIRFPLNQINRIVSGEISHTIRPVTFYNDLFFQYHREKWLWVQEPFHVKSEDEILYQRDSGSTELRFLSDKMMPIEYCRVFILASKLSKCKFSSLKDEVVHNSGFENREIFNSYWKERYGLLSFYQDNKVAIFRIHKVEVMPFNDFVTKYYSDGL